MDRLWSNVARASRSDSSKSRPAEIVIDAREHDSKSESSGLTLGSLVPDFMAETTQQKIDWHRWIGENWALLLGYASDFHPIAATELAQLAKMRNDFRERQVKVAVVSSNSVEDHEEFVHDIESMEMSNGSPIDFPLISDPDQTIVESYGMLDANVKSPNNELPVCCRALFLIGPDKRLKFSMLYPVKAGRNLSEVLRVIDAIQLNEAHEVLTPVNWAPGEPVLVNPFLSDPDAREKHGKFTTVSLPSARSYLRYVADPAGVAKSSFSWGGFLKTLLGVSSGIMIGAFGGKYIKPLRERMTSSR